MTSFAIATPSRGLVHSRTVSAVMANVAQAVAAGHEWRGWALTHDLPIPDCHEQATATALRTGADVLWLVEEDVVPPDGALLHLLACPELIALVDYPVGEHPTQHCIYRLGGEIAWFGLGCTLIARDVFEALERPWFRTDRIYRLRNGFLMAEDSPAAYGGQDVAFARRVLDAGFEVADTGLMAGHARLRALGPVGSNAGVHQIDVLHDVERAA